MAYICTVNVKMIVIIMIVFVGCNSDNSPEKHPSNVSDKVLETEYHNIEAVDYYERKLKDDNFVWEGPTSNEERIPYLHAARALAYIGDPAVPALFRSVRDKSIDINSLYDALREIGLPVYDHKKDIYENRDPSTIEKWWKDNREKTIAVRSEYRRQSGLPPIAAAQD